MVAGISLGPCLGLLELSSIAAGIVAGDAMVKRAAVPVLRTGTVHPGKYLVLVAGPVGDVEEAMAAGRESAGESLLEELFLPAVDPQVVAGVLGELVEGSKDAQDDAGGSLGILETRTVASVLTATDAAVKAAEVHLLTVGLADGLGGKGYALLAGELSEIEVALAAGEGVLLAPGAPLLARAIIPRLHEEMLADLVAGGPFAGRPWVAPRAGA